MLEIEKILTEVKNKLTKEGKYEKRNEKKIDLDSKLEQLEVIYYTRIVGKGL